VKVSSLVPGRVAELTVAEGDRVSAGQLIAKIDDHSFRDQIAQAEAGEATAQANVENAKLNLARNEDLVQRGIAARKDLEDARTESSVNAGALKQAQATLSTAKLQLSRTDIHSPISGRVVKRFVSGGEQVDGTAAAPIVEIADLAEVELDANVSASDLPSMKEGQSIQLTSASLPGKTYNVKIVSISSAVDPTSNAGVVRIRIPNASGDLRLGMFLGAQVPVETHARALTIPPGAIYRGEDGAARVFVVQGDTANVVPVTLGIEMPDRDEILSGIKEGDTIILNGGYGLTDKAKVTVGAPAAAAEAPGKKDDKDKKDDK
jgi:membrane fusion protein, multidrug efflux system